MTNEPGVISTSLIEFGQSGDYHTHSMTEAKEAAGFAPLETLPAEWYNNYIYKLDSHINRLQTVTRQMQVELSCVISSTSVEPSDTSLNQVNTAIQKKIADAAPGIATGSNAGVVTSSAVWSAVSVDPTTGVMTPNALCDWSPIYNTRSGCYYNTLASWLGPLAECGASSSTLAHQLSCLKETVLPLNDWDISAGTVDQLTVPDARNCVFVTDCYRFSFANLYNDTLNRPSYLNGLTLAYTGCIDNLNRELSLYAVAVDSEEDDSNKQLLSYCYCAALQKHTAVVGQWLACMYPDSCLSLYTISQDCLDPNETQAVWCMSTMNMNSINTYYGRCCTRSSDSRDSCVCYVKQACTNGTLATTLNYGVDSTAEYWYKTYNTIYNCGDSSAAFDDVDFNNALTMYGVNIRSYVLDCDDELSGSCVLLCSSVRAAVLGSDLALCNCTNVPGASDSIWCNACLTLVGAASRISGLCTVNQTLYRNITVVGNNSMGAVYSTTAVDYSCSSYSTRPSALVLGDNNAAVIELCSANTTTPPYRAAAMAVGTSAYACLWIAGAESTSCSASASVGAIGNCVTACSYYYCASKGEGRGLFVVGNSIYAQQTIPHFGVFVFGSPAISTKCYSSCDTARGVIITSQPGYIRNTFADLRCALHDALGGTSACVSRNITLHGSGQVGLCRTSISRIRFTTACACITTIDNQSVEFALSEYANVVQLMGVVSYQLL